MDEATAAAVQAEEDAGGAEEAGETRWSGWRRVVMLWLFTTMNPGTKACECPWDVFVWKMLALLADYLRNASYAAVDMVRGGGMSL